MPLCDVPDVPCMVWLAKVDVIISLVLKIIGNIFVCQCSISY